MKLHLQSAPLPAEAIPAWGQRLLELAGASSEGRLGLGVIGGPADLVGRYQRIECARSVGGWPASGTRDGPVLKRRLTGGCAYRVGSGAWVILMALPRLEELAAPGGAKLPLAKLLNRYMRPFLAGLNQVGARSFYPGRDRLRAGDGLLAMLSFHVHGNGPVLLEVLVNAAPGSLELAPMADRLGIPRDRWPELKPFVCFEQVGAVRATLAGFAAAVGQQLERAYGIELRAAGELDPSSLRIAAGPPLGDPASQGCSGAWASGQLGELWVGVRLDRARLSACYLRGAFLAPPAMLETVERSLVGSTLNPAELLGRLHGSGGNGSLLGLGPLEPLVDTIVRASRAGLS